MALLWAAALALVPLMPPPVVVRGQVVRIIAGDTVVAPGARVTLHRIGTSQQGAIDSSATDATGRFQLRAEADSTDVLLVSANWHGVEYFAQPVVAGTPVTVVVVDTASTAVVGLAARHLIIGGPAQDGTREVIDLVVLSNRSGFTRVAMEDSGTTWRFRLPSQAANLVVGDADFAADAFDVHGDTLLLHAPIPPGERQFFLQYQLAPGTRLVNLPMLPHPDTLSVLTEEESVDVGPALVRVADEEVQGRRFLRYVGGASVDTALVLGFDRGAGMPGWLLPALVVVLGLVLVLATRRALLPRARP